MTNQEIVNGLKQLGFFSGWVVNGDQIVLWENAEPQPKLEDIELAAKQWEAEAAAKKAAAEAKLAALGLTADDLKALGLGGN